MKKNINVVDIKKYPYKKVVLKPGENILVENITSKELVVIIREKKSFDYWEKFFEDIG